MKTRFGIALTAVLLAVAALAAAATAADVRIAEAAGTGFPQRTWVVSLPAGERVQPSQVKVSENGHRVVGLKVEPTSTNGNQSTGTALVIDASDSMKGGAIHGALKAARGFAAQRNVDQRLAVVTFNASTDVASSFTKSQDQITAALTKTPKLQYGTHLYDGVAQAIALIRAAGVSVGSVVILSDGADTGSTISLDQVTQNARDANIRLFTIAFRSKTFRPAALQQLATATGGSFSRANSQADLARIYDQLGLQLAHEYLVSYNSIEKPETPVKVKLSVAGVGATKAGYVTPALNVPNAVYHPGRFDGVWKSGWTMLALGLLIPALLAFAVLIPMRSRNSTIRARVSDYVSMPTRKQDADAIVSRVFTGTERGLERTRWWTRFKEGVQFSDVPFTPVQVVIGTVVLTLFAMYVLSVAGSPVLALLGLLVPVVVRAFILGRSARKRRLFGDQLPDNLDVLASGLRAGHSLIGSFAVVVDDAPEPSRTEFQRVIADEALGVSLEDALSAVSRRMKSRDMEQVALVASMQNETGGNAAEVLDRVVESIRERQEVRRLVRTLTAQGRLARWVVSLLPVGLLVAISVLNPEYMKPLFTHSSGKMLLGLAAAMIVAGSVVIGRIVDIDV
jgi:tight adherence protein B